MTKRKKQQLKRQKSRNQQVEMHERERYESARHHYQGSIQELTDMVNTRIRAVDGEDAAPASVGPDYKPKRRRATRN